MPISSNAPVSLTDIQNEFGGTSPISLSEYYSAVSGVPASGAINMGAFRGKSSSTTIAANTNYLQINASSYISSGGTLNIPSSVWIWSDNTGVPALNVDVANATIINNGKIIGKGGDGGNEAGVTSGGAGGPAIRISASGVQIQNNSGAYIAGGGGGGAYVNGAGANDAGGGGGAGGGRGGTSNPNQAGGAGGAIGQQGANGTGHNSGNIAFGGTAGGSGGLADESSSGSKYGTGAGGGGRILPGTQTATWTAGRSGLRALGKGGGGGQAGASGGTQGNGTAGNGGGGWGAPGGGSGGGAGGAAIQIASGSSGYTSSGTIYGSNAATLQYPFVAGTNYVSNGSATGSLNSNFGSWSLHQTVWDYGQSGYIWTFTVASNATGTLRVRSTCDPDNAPRSNSGDDRILRLYKNGGQIATVSNAAFRNAVMDTNVSVSGGDVLRLYMDNSLDWRDLGAFERIVSIYITGV